MTVVRSRRVVLPDGERPAALVIEDGRIAAIEPYDTPGEDERKHPPPGDRERERTKPSQHCPGRWRIR